VSQSHLVASGFFGALVLLAFLLRYEGSKSGATGTISFLPAIAGIVVAPVYTTVVAIGLSALIGELASRKPAVRVVFNTAQLTLTTSVAALAVISIRAIPLPSLATTVLQVVVAAILFQAVNTATVAAVIAISTGRTVSAVWMAGALRTLPYDVLAMPVVYLLVWSFTEKGIATVLLFVLPIFGLRQLYKQNWELENANEELLQVMVKAIEARDPYTSGHSVRVSRYAVAIAKVSRLDARRTEQLRIAAILHDVGKIHEEYAALLQKKERLTEQEMKVMETHPARSADLVASVRRLKDIVPALRGHHERWDGTGYPDRLAGDAIPLLARYIAIADTIDAMTSTRPYRPAMAIGVVREEIANGLGTQFDPVIAQQLSSESGWTSFLSHAELKDQARASAMASDPRGVAQMRV
jgi:HD-GYP domain-containing protein (c-di-GMP phosphodiesterase class II)